MNGPGGGGGMVNENGRYNNDSISPVNIKGGRIVGQSRNEIIKFINDNSSFISYDCQYTNKINDLDITFDIKFMNHELIHKTSKLLENFLRLKEYFEKVN